MVRTPSQGQAGLMVNMQAVICDLPDDDLVVDEAARRRSTGLEIAWNGMPLGDVLVPDRSLRDARPQFAERHVSQVRAHTLVDCA